MGIDGQFQHEGGAFVQAIAVSDERATDFLGGEMLYSWLNPPLPANGDKAWFGWPKDDEIDALRKAWLNKLNTSDSEVRQEIAAEIQERAFEAVPCIPTGQYWP